MPFGCLPKQYLITHGSILLSWKIDFTQIKGMIVDRVRVEPVIIWLQD